ncbi:MAG: amidohydrolase [Rhabdochlamydiaceae bacterium]|nr:amidohydrolase [Rhabdochlamydiaceae bacterium]
MKILLDQFIADAIKIRHHLHRIPELQYEERKTGAFIASTLRSYGYEIQEGIGKTGIVVILDSGKPGKTIAFRADIDALPISEATGSAHQSTHPGVMHACGHDGHTATLLLVARILQQIKPQLRGKIKLIFQPAEEGGNGSSAMIQDGVLKHPSVDAIFGYHNWPGLPLNSIATRAGCILAGSGRFEITIHGKRAHLSNPKDAINPVTIGVGIVKEIEALSIPMTVINLLGFNSGDWKQGTSERTEIVGCYFVEGEEAYLQLKQRIESIVGEHGTVTFHEFQSATVNTPQETEQVFFAARKAEIKDVQRLESCKMAAEDFSEYLKYVPGCYFLMGAGERTASLHTPFYDFPDEILTTAAQMFLQIAMENH